MDKAWELRCWSFNHFLHLLLLTVLLIESKCTWGAMLAIMEVAPDDLDPECILETPIGQQKWNALWLIPLSSDQQFEDVIKADSGFIALQDLHNVRLNPSPQSSPVSVFWIIDNISEEILQHSFSEAAQAVMASPPTALLPNDPIPTTSPDDYYLIKYSMSGDLAGYQLTKLSLIEQNDTLGSPVIIQATDIPLEMQLPAESLKWTETYLPAETMELSDERLTLSLSQLQSLPLPTIDFTHSWKRFLSSNSGGFSRVEFLRNQNSRRELAVKRAKHQTKGGHILAREISLLLQAQGHPAIVKLHGIGFVIPPGGNDVNPEIWLAMEYIPGDNLRELIRLNPDMVNEEFSRQIMIKILPAIEWLHSRDITHRDIKPHNIFLEVEDPHTLSDANRTKISTSAKLGDFGCAAIQVPGKKHALRTGSTVYLAPEQIGSNSENRYNGKIADIWSIGATVYACLIKANPYFNEYPDASTADIREQRSQPGFLELGDSRRLRNDIPGASQEVKSFIQDCCDTCPETRPDIYALQLKPWITGTK